MRNSCRGGSALLAALWATATLAALGIAQATRVSLESKWAGRLQESQQAGSLAWAGLELASDRLRRDPRESDAPKDIWGQIPERAIPFPPGTFNYKISDEQARIPLNAAPADLLATLPGFTAQSAEELVLQRTTPPGKRVAHLGELARLPGFDKDQMERLEPLVSVHGTGVNLNTASPDVLGRLLISPDTVTRIVNFRLGPDGKWGTPDDGIFPQADADEIVRLMDRGQPPRIPEQDKNRISTLISMNPPLLGVKSSFFRVELEGRTARHKILKKARAVVQREGPNLKIREWHEFR